MREWLRGLLGRTKLERIEGLQREHGEHLRRAQDAQREQADSLRSQGERLHALSQQIEQGQDRQRQEMVQHFEQMLQATSATVVERLGAAGSQRVATLAKEIVQLERRLLTAIQEHRQQMSLLTSRVEQLERGLTERDQLRQRVADEGARVRELADQTGHLLTELGTERAALHDLRSRAAVEDDMQGKLNAAQHELRAASNERDALRANTEALETARIATERVRDALQAELQRVTRQRDDLLRGDPAAGASS